MVNYYTYIEMFLDDIHKSVSLSEFEKHFKIPHQTVKAQIQGLLDSKILICDKRERFVFYRLNLENPLTFEHMIICEKERLFKFLKNELFNELYLTLSSYDAKICIFGSAVSGKYSDIDVMIVGKDVRDVLKKFGLTYNVKMHVVMIEKLSDKTFISELRKKHIIFNNHEYFVKLLYGFRNSSGN